jgi:Tol biopolymer transport system component
VAGGIFGSAGGKPSSNIAMYTLPQRRSVDTLTPDSTEPSLESTVSGDGRYVVFESLDPALHAPCSGVPNPEPLCAGGCPASGPLYVFRVDTDLGCVDLVSLDDSGSLIKMMPRWLGKGVGEEPLGKPSPSVDGNLVAFVADDTVTGKLHGEGKAARARRQKAAGLGILLRNMLTGSTMRLGTSASTGTDSASGQPINGGRPQVAPDGQSVVYTGILSGKPAVMQARFNSMGGFDTFCVACKTTGGSDPGSFTLPLDGFAHNPTVSANGQVVVYQTTAQDAATSACNSGTTNTSLILRHMLTGITRTINQPQGTTCQLGSASKPRMDYAGERIVFESTQPLTVGATSRREVYLFERNANRMQQISIGSGGTQTDAASGEPAISGDGRRIAFTSKAKQGFGVDLPPEAPTVSHIVVRELASATTRRLSENAEGAYANGDSFRPSMSYTGSVISFDSEATNLSASDANGTVSDVFLRVNPLAEDSVFGSGFE